MEIDLNMQKIIAATITSIVIAVITTMIKLMANYIGRNNESLKIKNSNLELLHSILKEQNWKKQENRIILEELFESMYRKIISFDEIRILINAKKPSYAARTYLKYRPALQLNDKKTKFCYKEGKRPYKIIFGKYRFPITIFKGCILYSILAFISLLGFQLLLNNAFSELDIFQLTLLWLLAIVLLIIALISLIVGLKYQDSEKEIQSKLSDKFQI